MIGKNAGFAPRILDLKAGIPLLKEIRVELVRKTLHFLIAFSPLMAEANRTLTVFLLMTGTLCYTAMEYCRLSGFHVPVISRLTLMAARKRDQGRVVLGPITLGLGALLALLLYPSPAASIAIYALAFGDGFASLIGKIFGRTRPVCLMGKSLEGSLACFFAVFFSSYAVIPNSRTAIFAALTAALAEALPLEDYDNIILPITVGFVVQIVSF
jgi:dolichol kinase